MRKITAQATAALYDGLPFKQGNTEVTHNLDGAKMFLHDNLIVVLNGSEVTLYNRGWFTNTTKERINGVISQYGWSVYARGGLWYIYRDGLEELFSEGITIDLGTKEVINYGK